MGNLYSYRQQQFLDGLDHLNEDISYFNLLEETFFCYANIEPPDETRLINWGPVARRMDSCRFRLAKPYDKVTQLQFCNSAQKNRPVNSVQIKMLIYGGWKVDIDFDPNFGFYWPAKDVPLFSEFMSKFATIKSNAAAAKTVKLLMNSIAGKLGQKNSDLIDTTHRVYTVLPEKRFTEFECEHNWLKRGTFDREMKIYDDFKTKNFNAIQTHYLAALIWSWSHFLFWTACYRINYWWINQRVPVLDRPPILLYCDTDSIFVCRKNSKIFDTKMDVANFFKAGDEMGSFVVAQHQFDTRWSCKFYDRILVMAKKCYWPGDQAGSAHFKGVLYDALIEFVENGGYEKLKTFAENHVANVQKIDGISDRPDTVEFTSRGINRRRIAHNKYEIVRCDGYRNTVLRYDQKVSKNLSFKTIIEHVPHKFFEKYIQVFSPTIDFDNLQS